MISGICRFTSYDRTMRAQLRLFQTACVVSFMLNIGGGHGVVVSHDESRDVNIPSLSGSDRLSVGKIAAEPKTITDRNVMAISPGFTSLFDSVAKNDSRKNGVLDRLKENVAQEQQAFDAMKEELQTTLNRKRNSMKSRIPDNGNLVLAKREANDNNIMDDLVQLENSYIHRFGDDVNYFSTWEMMRQWYYRGGIDALKRFCRGAHAQAGMGEVTIRSLVTWPRTINFRNKKFSAVRADVVMYEIEESGGGYGENPFFVARGIKPDCVYYLQQWKSDPHRYYLTKHVCGIVVHAGRDVVRW